MLQVYFGTHVTTFQEKPIVLQPSVHIHIHNLSHNFMTD